MRRFAPDLAYAWRGLRRAPGFCFVSIVTLSLGVGANTALFSLVNGVLLKPIPVRNLDRLALVTRVERTTGRALLSISDDDLQAVSKSRPQMFFTSSC